MPPSAAFATTSREDSHPVGGDTRLDRRLRFYEKQAPGVGVYFLDTLYAGIDSLVVSAGIHPLYFGRYLRLLSRRFPFAVYYRVEGQVATVYAVLDCRRSPAWIRTRIG